MPQRAKSMCKSPVVLLCWTSRDTVKRISISLRSVALDKRKRQSRRVLQFLRLDLASKRHRAKEPLCRQCKREGIISKGELVHHNPPLDELKARGLNPLDDKYLETLCFNCHQKELRRKRG